MLSEDRLTDKGARMRPPLPATAAWPPRKTLVTYALGAIILISFVAVLVANLVAAPDARSVVCTDLAAVCADLAVLFYIGLVDTHEREFAECSAGFGLVAFLLAIVAILSAIT